MILTKNVNFQLVKLASSPKKSKFRIILNHIIRRSPNNPFHQFWVSYPCLFLNGTSNIKEVQAGRPTPRHTDRKPECKSCLWQIRSRNFQNRLNMRYTSSLPSLIFNFHVCITYRFRNLMYLVILTKNVYFQLVKLPCFTPKKRISKNLYTCF